MPVGTRSFTKVGAKLKSRRRESTTSTRDHSNAGERSDCTCLQLLGRLVEPVESDQIGPACTLLGRLAEPVVGPWLVLSCDVIGMGGVERERRGRREA